MLQRKAAAIYSYEVRIAFPYAINIIDALMRNALIIIVYIITIIIIITTVLRYVAHCGYLGRSVAAKASLWPPRPLCGSL